MRTLLRKVHRNEQGVTGLETAIILIAFVVVASVFAYTVLSAGIFSSQKGQEAIYAGLEQARSAITLKGSVIGYSGTVGSTATLVKVKFTVEPAVGGEPLDLAPPYQLTAGALAATTNSPVTSLTYMDQKQFINGAAWTLTWIGKNDGDTLLEADEKAEITLWLFNYNGTAYSLGTGDTDPWIDAAANVPGTYMDFTIQVVPPAGSVLTIPRGTPAKLDTVMDFH